MPAYFLHQLRIIRRLQNLIRRRSVHKMPISTNATTSIQTCIDACNACMQACEECYTACLNEPDVQARIMCIRVLRDCADICSLSSQYMSRNSEFSAQLCATCATICDACATECAKMKDTHCQKCADMCRKCADECRMMASQA